ncbi:MAG TPA: extracellular solute-binding protein [bacterium]|nr:extracellular solute-binding protein [bacterium]
MLNQARSRRDLIKLAARMTVGLSVLSTAGRNAHAAGKPAGNLTFWWWGEQLAPGLKTYVGDAMPKFESQYPGSHVNAVLQASESLLPGFASACQAKQGADVQFMWSGSYVLGYVFQGCVKPVSDLLDKAELQHIQPDSLNETLYDGKIWGYPWFASPHLLVYNKSAFAKAGVNPDTPFRRWPEFLTAMDKLRAAGYVPWGWGVRGLTGIANVVGMLSVQNLNDTHELLPVITGKVSYTDPRYSSWLQWVDELQRRHVFNDDVTSLDYSQGQDLFAAGRAAMTEAGGAQVADYANKLGVDNVGISLPPIVGTGKLAGRMPNSSEQLLVTGWGNVDLAVALLKFLHTPPQLEAMYAASGALPTDNRFRLRSPKIPQHKLLATWLQTSALSNYQNVWPSQMDRGNLFLAVQSLLGGQLSPTAAAKQIDDGLRGWRAQNPDTLKNFEMWAASIK